MSGKIECDTHGISDEAFVCSHLVGRSAGLGFNRNDPTPKKPFPDAWCDECEEIRASYNGWNKKTEGLVEIKLLCSGCYENTRIRNTRTSFTLDDLDNHRWKCGSCDKWHTGPALDFAYSTPDYWRQEFEQKDRIVAIGKDYPATFLNKNYCAIEDRDFFVRGIIYLPIIGTAETLRWGVWGSLSRENFEALLKMDTGKQFTPLPPMFSWLSNNISAYPKTLSLKMYAHVKSLTERPRFELELTDHPLSQEFHKGITPQRVKEIMTEQLQGNEL